MVDFKNLTQQIKEVSDFNHEYGDLTGGNIFNGRRAGRDEAIQDRTVTTEQVVSERNRTRIMQERERQIALAGGESDRNFRPVNVDDAYGEVDSIRRQNENYRRYTSNYYGNGYPPQYSSRITQNDRYESQHYNQNYERQTFIGSYGDGNNRPAPYNNIDGILTSQETRRGLDNAGLTSNPAALQDFASDLQAISDNLRVQQGLAPIPLVYNKNGQTMLSMDNVAAALTEYARKNPQINLRALEAGDPNAWQALDAFLDSDAQRFGRGAGNTIASNTPMQNPSSPNQAPTPSKTYTPDEKLSQRIGELIGEELSTIKDPKERAAKAQEISNQIAAALQAKGIKVQGNPIDELSGYLISEKSAEADIIKNGSKADAAKALRQATGDLDAEAKRALTIAKINTPPVPAQNGQANNQGTNNNAPNPAQEEKLLVDSLERGQSINKVSDIKQHLNKITGSKFKEDDNVNEAGFITTLNQTLKQNLDPRTYNDMLNGGAFTAKGTLELIENNMGNRANVEQNRKNFEEGFKDGAAKQVINTTLNESGQDGHIKLQQDLRKIGYDSPRGLEGSLKEYLGDKLYNQGNFRTAPESVQRYIKDVESGNYKDAFPLTNPSNAAQMREVMDYVQDSVNLDLAKKEKGLAFGKSANIAVASAIVNEQQKPNTIAPTQPKTPTLGDGGATHYEPTLGTTVDSSRWSQNVQQTSVKNGEVRLERDIATASRNDNPEFVNFHNNFAAKNKPDIDNEIARQNKRNEIALQNREAEQKANQVLDVKVTEQKSEVSKNPPTITAPTTPVEKPQPTTPQQPVNITAKTNTPNAELVKGISGMLTMVPADKKGEITKALEAQAIKVETGKEAEAIAKFVEQKYPEKVEALKKGDMGAAMSIIQELQKQSTTAPATPVINKTEIANNPMQKALSQFNTEVKSTSTVTGGQEANGVQVGILPVDMRKPNAVGNGIGA